MSSAEATAPEPSDAPEAPPPGVATRRGWPLLGVALLLLAQVPLGTGVSLDLGAGVILETRPWWLHARQALQWVSLGLILWVLLANRGRGGEGRALTAAGWLVLCLVFAPLWAFRTVFGGMEAVRAQGPGRTVGGRLFRAFSSKRWQADTQWFLTSIGTDSTLERQWRILGRGTSGGGTPRWAGLVPRPGEGEFRGPIATTDGRVGLVTWSHQCVLLWDPRTQDAVHGEALLAEDPFLLLGPEDEPDPGAVQRLVQGISRGWIRADPAALARRAAGPGPAAEAARQLLEALGAAAATRAGAGG